MPKQKRNPTPPEIEAATSPALEPTPETVGVSTASVTEHAAGPPERVQPEPPTQPVERHPATHRVRAASGGPLTIHVPGHLGRRGKVALTFAVGEGVPAHVVPHVAEKDRDRLEEIK